ncbi:YbaK/EbsC family protein [Lachnospiraceae bacterium 62-35]
MAIEKVKEYLKPFGRDKDVLEFEVSSATVELAAHAVGVEPARIAKTMSFCTKEEGGCLLVVTAGDRKIDNSKFKSAFGMKAKMPKGEEVEALTGHEIGGVCPFANPEGVSVYLDESLKRFSTIFPAAGSSNSAIELSCEELERLSLAVGWVDVCKEMG